MLLELVGSTHLSCKGSAGNSSGRKTWSCSSRLLTGNREKRKEINQKDVQSNVEGCRGGEGRKGGRRAAERL